VDTDAVLIEKKDEELLNASSFFCRQRILLNSQNCPLECALSVFLAMHFSFCSFCHHHFLKKKIIFQEKKYFPHLLRILCNEFGRKSCRTEVF
jgi:hypothetical protein